MTTIIGVRRVRVSEPLRRPAVTTIANGVRAGNGSGGKKKCPAMEANQMVKDTEREPGKWRRQRSGK